MEKLSHSNLGNLLLILLGGSLLTIVLIDLVPPVRSSLKPTTQSSTVAEQNWFSQRTFDLLAGGQAPFEGIDIKLIAELNPFMPAAPIAESAAAEQAVVEPEPSPPPATRPLSVVYRGLYRSSGGDAFVYAEIEGAMRVVSAGEELVPAWAVDEVSASQLILKKGEVRVQIPFNQSKNLEVPIN